MAKFQLELPNELVKQFEDLCDNTMTEEMIEAGAEVVYNNIKTNMTRAFKNTSGLESHLSRTRVYRTKDGSVNKFVGFWGYDGEPTKQYPKGTPIPLKVMAREYGTSRGEKKKPFLRKSFNKQQIQEAMMQVQNKYIKEE